MQNINKIKRQLVLKLESKGYEVVINDFRIIVRTNEKDLILTNKEIEKLSILL